MLLLTCKNVYSFASFHIPMRYARAAACGRGCFLVPQAGMGFPSTAALLMAFMSPLFPVGMGLL